MYRLSIYIIKVNQRLNEGTTYFHRAACSFILDLLSLFTWPSGVSAVCAAWAS